MRKLRLGEGKQHAEVQQVNEPKQSHLPDCKLGFQPLLQPSSVARTGCPDTAWRTK